MLEKLKPLTVLRTPNKDKGWDKVPELGSFIWVSANEHGGYSVPYEVEVVATVERNGLMGCLIYNTTYVDNFYGHVSSNLDIIGSSSADVYSKVASLLSKQQEQAERLRLISRETKAAIAKFHKEKI